MHKIIIDTDPGIDDAQAIAFAIAHPQIDLLGLSTVFGNADIDTTSRNALKLLEIFARPDIPVVKGASKPLVQQRLPAPDFVHGVDGLGNLNLDEPSVDLADESAADFIVRMANEQPGEITVVAVGPLSNIALAVGQDPTLPSKLKQLIVMGGTVQQAGNVSPVAEANFLGDPHAADIVCAHDWPLKIIGLDVTLKVMLRDEHLASLRDKAGETGQFIWDSSRFYVDFYTADQNQAGLENPVRQCAMHDASAVVCVVEEGAFKFVSGGARVIPDGIAIGQLALNQKANSGIEYAVPHWQNRPLVHAAMQVDAERVRNTFLNTLMQHALN